MNKKLSLWAVLLIAVLCQPLSATLITPGASTFTGTLFTDAGAGYQLVASQTQTVTPGGPGIPATYSGTLTSAVYLNTATGFLDFLYQFSNGPAIDAGDSVRRITVSNFSGFTTDVGYRTSTVGPFVAGTPADIPVFFDRSGGAGSTVGFQYFDPNTGVGPVIQPLETSQIMVVRTNATNYRPGNVSTIDGTSANVLGFAPASGVPEPATMSLMGGGLVLAGLLRRRLRSK